jgi:hypothetical protein
MKPIFNTGDKVYLTQEDDFTDYEIVEISAADVDNHEESSEYFKYKIKPVKGQGVLEKSESEIFPITA